MVVEIIAGPQSPVEQGVRSGQKGKKTYFKKYLPLICQRKSICYFPWNHPDIFWIQNHAWGGKKQGEEYVK